MINNEQLQQQFTTDFVDLAAERVGGETLACSDDFFAEMENLLKAGRGIFIDDKYTERGKWMEDSAPTHLPCADGAADRRKDAFGVVFEVIGHAGFEQEAQLFLRAGVAQEDAAVVAHLALDALHGFVEPRDAGKRRAVADRFVDKELRELSSVLSADKPSVYTLYTLLG